MSNGKDIALRAVAAHRESVMLLQAILERWLATKLGWLGQNHPCSGNLSEWPRFLQMNTLTSRAHPLGRLQRAAGQEEN